LGKEGKLRRCVSPIQFETEDTISFLTVWPNLYYNHAVTEDDFRLFDEFTGDVWNAMTFGGTSRAARRALVIRITPGKLYRERTRCITSVRDEINVFMHDFENWRAWKMCAESIDSEIFAYNIFCLPKRVAQPPLSRDVLLIGHTGSTNRFGLPLMAILVPDPEGKNQLLSLALIHDHTQSRSLGLWILFSRQLVTCRFSPPTVV
jgi:hypothetical protein